MKLIAGTQTTHLNLFGNFGMLQIASKKIEFNMRKQKLK